jgi:hypothetical protein
MVVQAKCAIPYDIHQDDILQRLPESISVTCKRQYLLTIIRRFGFMTFSNPVGIQA